MGFASTATIQFTASATAVGSSPCGNYRRLLITLSGLTGETVALKVSPDNGVTYSAALGCTPIAGGALVTALTNGTYVAGPDICGLLPACTHFSLTKSAGVETVVCKVCLST